MKIRRSDIIWNYIGTFLSLSSNFIVMPVILHYLDGDVFGLWYVFLSIGGIVLLFDFGFNPTIARNVAFAWSGAKTLKKENGEISNNQGPNYKLLKKVLVTSKSIYLIISLSAFIILVIFGTRYINKLTLNLSGKHFILAWYIYSTGIFLNLYYGYYATFLRGVGAIRELNISISIGRLIQMFVLIFLLINNFGILANSISFVVYGLTYRFLSKKFFYKYQDIGKNLDDSNEKIKINEITEVFNTIWYNAWKDGLVSLSSYLSNQATVFIASLFLSLSLTGIYSITLQITNAIAIISGSLYVSYQPRLQSLYIEDKIEESKNLMAEAMTVYIIIYWLGIICFVLIGIPLISSIRTDIVFSKELLIVISIYVFLLMHHSFYASFISNTNKVPYYKSFVLSGIVSIFFSYYLLKYTSLGIYALVVAPLIIQGIYNNWRWPKYVLAELNISIFDLLYLGYRRLIRRVVDCLNYFLIK